MPFVGLTELQSDCLGVFEDTILSDLPPETFELKVKFELESSDLATSRLLVSANFKRKK
jgi:hypothetical protein